MCLGIHSRTQIFPVSSTKSFLMSLAELLAHNAHNLLVSCSESAFFNNKSELYSGCRKTIENAFTVGSPINLTILDTRYHATR